MDGDITLRLNRATAEDLYATLYEVGEHIVSEQKESPRDQDADPDQLPDWLPIGAVQGAGQLVTNVAISETRLLSTGK